MKAKSTASGDHFGEEWSASASSSPGLKVRNTATSGFANGVAGITDSSDGWAVFGRALSNTGPTQGLRGVSDSEDGKGIYGHATASSGYTQGVFGRVDSPNGWAVFGKATASTGSTIGLRGLAASDSGKGVFGHATASSGATQGVFGRVDSPDGTAIRGKSTATSGQAVGIKGTTASADDGTVGVSGQATASGTSGETYGVKGVSNTDVGVSTNIFPSGVQGVANGSGRIRGVKGKIDSKEGTAIDGRNTKSPPNVGQFNANPFGIQGITDYSGEDTDVFSGYGVFGWGNATSGRNIGVLGRVDSGDGTAVWGYNAGGGPSVVSNGHIEIMDGIMTRGELSFPDGSPQATAGPVAKGFINSDGTIANAVNVSSSSYSSSNAWYRITIQNESYVSDKYATYVTPYFDSYVCNTLDESGDLLIEVVDQSGNPVQGAFQFVTHKLVSSTAGTANSTEDESQTPEGF